MKLNEFLLEKRTKILSAWFERIIDNFPSDATAFLKNQKNPFSNPVGNTLSTGTACLFDGLVQGSDLEKFCPCLNDIIKITAVQDFPPSKAVSFMIIFKDILQETLERDPGKYEPDRELASLMKRIDDLTLLSFDIFMKCREQIYDIKANEARRSTFRLLQKANLITEVPEEDLKSDTVLTRKIEG